MVIEMLMIPRKKVQYKPIFSLGFSCRPGMISQGRAKAERAVSEWLVSRYQICHDILTRSPMKFRAQLTLKNTVTKEAGQASCGLVVLKQGQHCHSSVISVWKVGARDFP